jgi:NAD(P)H-nitrite reductase large subunit
VGRLAESGRSLRRLRRARVPIEFERLVVRAEGTDELEAVVVASVDGDWRVRPGTEERIECDTLALGYGFVPSTELARQAGCASTWAGEAGGWVVVHDEHMRTSRAEIFVAGEIAGVAGAEQASDEGRVAALEILRDLGKLDERRGRTRRRRADRALRRARRFSRAVQRQFAPRYGALAAIVDNETVVCRCEGVTAGQLSEALASNPHLGTADAVKLLTRVGMGPCQGRSCTTTVAHLVARATGRAVEEIGAFAARPPVKPFTLGALADADTLISPR